MRQDFRNTVLITAAELKAARSAGTLLSILAVRSEDSSCSRPFSEAPRIPGALDTSMELHFAAPSHPQNGVRPLPNLKQLEHTIQKLGLNRQDAIVVYDHDGNLQAARVWWVLRWAGFKTVFMLDGGFQAWATAGFPISHTEPPPPASSNEMIEPGNLPQLDADSAAFLGRNGILIDSRIAPNFKGGITPAGASRRGHIPGAHNIPAPDNLTADGFFRDLDTLRAQYAAIGADGSRPVGVYCGAGVSAAHDVAVLMMLGIEAPMYPGSWSAWISDPERPVEIGDKLC
ncbi:thiosulfate sulfurtransferase [Gluconobacter oxydans]|uniref:sulfurtransferase n=1 Tax=Gluconobacter thailandicus TaxID=257438 RepID=UPI00029997F7|nr:rhodanese-like domain-containing protein [Gluconobacter thailandicus]AFW00717.1 thiosulfate sulfurtransferase [Gluconobacter oxydans H24]ANQ40590.1 thiosulfate sulfurtransferase [Gluconobacter oxydans]